MQSANIKSVEEKKRAQNSLVFPVLKDSMSEQDKLMAKNQFMKTINKYMKRIGQKIWYDKPLTTYAARHLYATILKRSGAPLDLFLNLSATNPIKPGKVYLDSFEDETRRKYA